jgi:anti-sigma factor RsiW
VKGKLPAYVEGSLEIRIAQRVEGHLAGCPACRREEKILALLMGAIGDLPSVRARPSFASDVLRSVRLQEEVVAVAGPGWRTRLAVAGAVAAVAAAVVLPRIWVRMQSPGVQPGVASGRPAQEFVLPVAAPEERLAGFHEPGAWPPERGRVRVSLVMDQNVSPRVPRNDVYVLDRTPGWRTALRTTL